MLVVAKERQQTAEEYLDYVRRHGTLNTRDDYGIPALSSAIDKFRSLSLVEELLQDGADVNAVSCVKQSSLPHKRSLDTIRCRYKRWGDFAPIHVASSLGLYDMVKLLFDHGAEICQTSKGYQPVDFLLNTNITRCLDNDVGVSEEDDYDIIKLMHTVGVDLSTKEKHYQQSTLLHRATICQNQTIMNYLIHHGCEVNCVDCHGKTPLQYCKVDALECARILLKNGADLNVQNNFGNTMYHTSLTYYGDHSSNRVIDYLRLLHEYHADPNIRNGDGETALHIFFKKLNHKMGVEELIMILNELFMCGADPNIADELERTPIYYLIRYSHTETLSAWNIVWLLLKTSLSHEAILNKGDIIGIPLLHQLVESCLWCTKYFDSNSFMEVLHSKYNVEVNCQDLHGRTVLHLVSAKGNWAMAEILIHHGADFGIEDCDGNTPLHVAILCKQWEFAKKIFLLPLRNNFVSECTGRDDQTHLRENRSALNEFKKIRRSYFIPAVMYQHGRVGYFSENKNSCLTDCCSCDIRKERLKAKCNTISISKQCKEPDKSWVMCEKQSVEWTPKKLEIIANYVEHQVLSWDSVETEIRFFATIDCPASLIDRDFLSGINKSSLLELCEENCVGEFHLTEECEEEHCMIAKQVYRLVTDLVQKCSEIDPRLKSKLLWTGSSAEGTKMWLPDEFDFLMELVELRGNCESDDRFSELLIRKEYQELWSNLCQHPCRLSIVRLKEYIATLLWKAAFYLEKKKYDNIRFKLCQYDRMQHFIKRTKVGVNIKVVWHGEKYKKMVISIDLTPAIPVALTVKQLPRIHRHSVGRLAGNEIHVIPYFKYGGRERWRPSFSLTEVDIMKTLSWKQIALYKALKFFRDIHQSVFEKTPSYHLKTFLFNYFFRNDGTRFHVCFAERDSFHTSLCHMVYHLNGVAAENFVGKNQHFFLNYDLSFADYDMRWVKSSQDILENL